MIATGDISVLSGLLEQLKGDGPETNQHFENTIYTLCISLRTGKMWRSLTILCILFHCVWGRLCVSMQPVLRVPVCTCTSKIPRFSSIILKIEPVCSSGWTPAILFLPIDWFVHPENCFFFMIQLILLIRSKYTESSILVFENKTTVQTPYPSSTVPGAIRRIKVSIGKMIEIGIKTVGTHNCNAIGGRVGRWGVGSGVHMVRAADCHEVASVGLSITSWWRWLWRHHPAFRSCGTSGLVCLLPRSNWPAYVNGFHFTSALR